MTKHSFLLVLLVVLSNVVFAQNRVVLIDSTNGLFSHLVSDGNFVYFNDECTKSISKLPNAGGSVSLLATNQVVTTLCTFDKYLYWCGNGAIKAMPTSGGQVVTLASNSNWNLYEGIQGLRVDNSGVYWTVSGPATRFNDSGMVLGIPGMSIHDSQIQPRLLADHLRVPDGLLLDDDFLYVKEGDPTGANLATIKKMSKNGGAPHTLAKGFSTIVDFTEDKTSLYFCSDKALYKMSKLDGRSRRIGNFGESSRLSAGAVAVCVADFDSSTLSLYGFKSSMATLVISNLTNIRTAIQDANYVYWSEGTFQGKIKRALVDASLFTDLYDR